MEYDRFGSLDDTMKEGVDFLVHDGTYMVTRAHAKTFADRLLDKGALVLGIEGFYFDGESLIPNMECIVDLNENGSDHEAVLRGVDFAVATDSHFLEFTLN